MGCTQHKEEKLKGSGGDLQALWYLQALNDSVTAGGSLSQEPMLRAYPVSANETGTQSPFNKCQVLC
jgi:hypothetical protein